jgi:predicted nucleotide-binding protein
MSLPAAMRRKLTDGACRNVLTAAIAAHLPKLLARNTVNTQAGREWPSLAGGEAVTKPTVFIGSSSEGKDIANGIGNYLEDVAEVRIWTEGLFNLSQRFFDSVFNAGLRFDFAVIICTSDDSIEKRTKRSAIPRDNIIFEAGYFMGSLGVDRTFVVRDLDADLTMPSDLEGVAFAGFHGKRHDGNLAAALRGVSDTIRTTIRELGPVKVSRPVEVKVGADRLIVSHDSTGWSRPLHIRQTNEGIAFRLCGAQVNIKYGRIEEVTSDVSTAIVLPANEFFDDECINDPRSALGSFFQAHFPNRIHDIQEQIRAGLQLSAATPVEKRPGIVQDSFGVGTCVFLDRPLQSQHRLILAAVTTDRHGIRSEVSFLIKALREIVAITSANRISSLCLPLMGAGHGCLRPEVSLLATLLGLHEAFGSGGRNLKAINLIIFRDARSDRPPAISLPIMTQITSSLAGMLT